MKDDILVYKALLGVELFEISSKFINKLRNEHPNPNKVFGLLPTYTLRDNGSIAIAEYHHQFVGTFDSEKEEKYLYFNLTTLDALLQEEINNVGFEDLFEKDLDFRKILSSFVPQIKTDASNFIFPHTDYLVIETTYTTSVDHEGGYDCETDVKVVGYLDNSLALNSLPINSFIKSDKLRNGAEVKLPFGEVGIIDRFQELMWGSRYWVKITESNGFNEVGEVVDFFEKDLINLNK